MILRYIQVALDRAHYEMIEDEEPYYGEVPELEGVWATGQTLEGCRRNLAEAIEDWLLLSIAKGLPIPAIGDVSIHIPQKVAAQTLAPRPPPPLRVGQSGPSTPSLRRRCAAAPLGSARAGSEGGGWGG